MMALNLERAIEQWEGSLAYAQPTGDPNLICMPLIRMSSALVSLGRLEEGERLACEGCEQAASVLNWSEYSVGLAYRAAIAYHRSDLSAVHAYVARDMVLARRSHHPSGPVICLPMLAGVRCFQGDFEAADDALGFAISELCFNGPAEQLQLTENTQPAILTASIAALRAMESAGLPGPAFVAGHRHLVHR